LSIERSMKSPLKTSMHYTILSLWLEPKIRTYVLINIVFQRIRRLQKGGNKLSVHAISFTRRAFSAKIATGFCRGNFFIV
jgi:hypothetical protein